MGAGSDDAGPLHRDGGLYGSMHQNAAEPTGPVVAITTNPGSVILLCRFPRLV
jgi:hypothetical protein